MRRREFNQSSLFLATLALSACSSSSFLNSRKQEKSSKFKLWWIQSYYPAETEALSQVVAEWEEKNNTKVEITYFNDGAINRDAEHAITNGNPPDMMFSITAEFSLYPKLAWENKLADISDVVRPVENLFSPSALKAVSYKNGTTGNRSYYAIPLVQSALSVHYWRDMLAEVGLSDTNIPKDWDGFWQFWKTAQDLAIAKGKKDIYGIGLPMSVEADDTISIFEQFLEAYGVQLLDSNGELRTDDPNVRSGIVKALTKYAGFYADKYVPPTAVEWSSADNNQSFLSRNVFMTVNPGLSIPVAQQFDKEVYNKKLITIQWPNSPSGTPLSYLSAVKQAVIFADSTNQATAKSLLTHIIKPNNLLTYLKGAGGRYFPTMPELLADNYYKDSQDPHILSVAKQFEKTTSFYTAQNPAHSEVGAKQVWGKAIKAVAKGASPEQAADSAIAQIKEIYTQWK